MQMLNTHDDDNTPETLETLALARANLQSALPFREVSTTALAPRASTYADAFRVAGLDWSVEKVPLYMREADAKARRAPGSYGIRRADTNAYFGHVGERYTPAQNVPEIAGMLDAMLGSLGGVKLAPIARKVEFRGGAAPMVLLDLPEQLTGLLQVRRDESERKAQIGVRWSHDGSTSVRADLGIWRMVCSNGIVAFDESAPGLRLKHTSGNVSRLEGKAKVWLRQVGETIARTGETLRALDARPVGFHEVRGIVAEILDPEQKETHQAKAKIDAVMEMIETRDGVFVPAGEVTRLSLLEAFTAYDAHRVPVRAQTPEARAERRMERVVSGEGIGARAFEVLIAA